MFVKWGSSVFLRATRAAELFAGRSAAWHSIAAIAAVAGLLLTGQAAQADCTPASGNNVTASCTGTTINQAGGAPGTSAGSDGYGTGTETGLNVTVVPDASVAGTNSGITFSTGTVINSGSISGGSFGIVANTATVTNSGSISGGSAGINANTATVTNSGTISGGTYGIFAGTTATVTNSGSISGGGNGIFANTATVTNSGAISGGSFGIRVNNTATVTNSGTISGGSFGVRANTATVTNSGTISGGSRGIFVNNTATVTNSGSISGVDTGIGAFTANVTNSGTISGGVSGVGIGANIANVTNSGSISGGNSGISDVTASVTNSGSISGGTGITLTGGAGSTLVNSGTIIGTGGNAIDFSLSNSDSLTFLPGTRITGAILLGANDNVSVVTGRDVSSLTTFTPTGPYTLTVGGSAPFVVLGNQVAIVDPTSFATADRTMMDFTRSISGLIGSRSDEADATGGATPTAFAPTGGIAAQAQDAFAQIPGLAYANDDAIIFKNPTVTTADGRTVWAKGFVGERIQQADGPTLRTMTNFYGGAMGLDSLFYPDLRLGGFVGGGATQQSIDLNSGSAKSNIGFTGLYGRYKFGASFLDFALTGGLTQNSTTRNINSNLAGLQTATASFGGWFISPELAYGYHYALDGNWSLTPAARVRYVAASFAGYTETGSSANLTVNSRTLQNVEERGDLTLTHTTTFANADRLRTSVYAGVLGLQRVGDATVNTILLGQSLAFATLGKSDVGGVYAGAGMDWFLDRRISLFAAAEYTAMSDASTTVTAKGGMRFAF